MVLNEREKPVNASETQNLEFRCMVTDGKPCGNQKILLPFFCFDFAMVILDANGSFTTECMALETKKNTWLSVSQSAMLLLSFLL